MNRRSNPVLPSTSSSPRARSHRGAVLQVMILSVTAGVIIWAGIASVTAPTSSSTVAPAKRAKFRSPPTAIEIEASLGELGLTPGVLAAAGFTVNQTSIFTAAAANHMREHIADYRAAQDAVHQARKEVNRLTRLIQGGAATEQDITALGTANTSLTAAIAQQQSILAAALAAGTGAAPAAPVELVNTFRGNSRAWDMPVQYLGDTRSAAQWLTLRDALANDRISASQNIAPDPTLHQVLLEAQGTTNGAAAITNLVGLPDIQAAWTQAIGN